MTKLETFTEKHLDNFFAYVTNRIPEITDDLYKIDDAMSAGFGWEHGPFQIWDAVGLDKGLEFISAVNGNEAAWIAEMKDAGIPSFYTVKEGKTYFYDIETKSYKIKPGQDGFIILDNIRESKAVYSNNDVVVEDLGDGILNCEFRSKMNTIGADVLTGLNKAVEIAEKDFQGLVVGNQGANFSVGANIGMIFMMAVEQEYEEQIWP